MIAAKEFQIPLYRNNYYTQNGYVGITDLQGVNYAKFAIDNIKPIIESIDDIHLDRIHRKHLQFFSEDEITLTKVSVVELPKTIEEYVNSLQKKNVRDFDRSLKHTPTLRFINSPCSKKELRMAKAYYLYKWSLTEDISDLYFVNSLELFDAYNTEGFVYKCYDDDRFVGAIFGDCYESTVEGCIQTYSPLYKKHGISKLLIYNAIKSLCGFYEFFDMGEWYAYKDDFIPLSQTTVYNQGLINRKNGKYEKILIH